MFEWLSFSIVHLKIGNYIFWWKNMLIQSRCEITALKEKEKQALFGSLEFQSWSESSSCASLDVS